MKKCFFLFYHDESGGISLEVVMILAIAAMVVAAIIMFAREIISWCAQQLSKEL